jgi:hypothetical protein
MRNGCVECLLSFTVASALACGGTDLTVPPPDGTVAVVTRTTGVEQDADGYMVQVDGATSQPIPVAGSIHSTGLAAGSHSVGLDGIASNCTLADNPRSIQVTAGETTSVTFEVTCHATTGSLSVAVTSGGPSADPDGYTLTLDGGAAGALAANGQLSLDGVKEGNHEVGLSGVSGNCSVVGDNPQTVAVLAGESATVSFAVTCVAPPTNSGTLRVTTATAGSDLDPNGYSFQVDGGAGQPIGVNAAATLPNVAAGAHTVQLSGLAQNCAVQGDNPRTVTVVSGAGGDLQFAITCNSTGPASGSIKITTVTSGANPDVDGYTLSLDGGAANHIDATGSYTFEGVPAAAHHVLLAGLAPGCVTTDNPRAVSVAERSMVTATFQVTCSSLGVTHWAAIPIGNAYQWSDLWGSGSTNLLVTGSAGEPDRSTIQHYDGRQWSEQLHGQDTTIVAVWGSSATEAFAVGHQSLSSTSRSGALLHSNGSEWSAMPGPDYGEGVQVSYNGIWGASAQDVFVGGFISRPGSPTQLFVHYDGSKWSEMPSNGFGLNAGIGQLSGTSPINVWAIGTHTLCDDCNRHVNFVAHYDGTSWTQVYSTTDASFYGLWVGAANDVWVVGEGFDGEGYMLHFDGATWKETSRRTPEGVGLPPVYDVWGSSGSDIYAVGGEGVLHFDGSSWKPIDNRPAFHVWGTSATDIFVLDETAVRHGTP